MESLESLISTSIPLLLKKVRILDAIASNNASNEPELNIKDILITPDRKIQIGVDDLSMETEANVQICDRPDLILGTGLVDLYSSSGEPGFEQRETFSSLAAAAKHGGFSQIGILPNTQPAIDDPASVDLIRNQLSSPFLPWGAVTRGCEGKQISDLAELAPLVIGFTDAKPIPNLALVRRLMEYVKPLGKPLMLWAWDVNLAGDGVMREGKWSVQYGLSGIPIAAETSALSALLELVALTQTPTHFMRLSTSRSVELIAEAKNKGLSVTASVPWMNLWLEDKNLDSYDPNLRLSPPLGSEIDRKALIAGLKSGVIDAIATDHAPYNYEEKNVAFEVAPSGAIGLELVLPILWQQLVESGHLTALELWQALSSRPAQCLGIKSPSLSTLFDPNLDWAVTANTLASQACNSPCYSKSIKGKAFCI